MKRLLEALPVYVLVGLLWFSTYQANVQARANDLLIAQSNSRVAQDIAALRPFIPIYKGMPTLLEIPRLGVTIDVNRGIYDIETQSWTLSDDKTHHAVQTLPNNNTAGLTLIYGHNTNAVLGRTAGLKKGDLAVVTTLNNLRFTYEFQGNKVVDPTDTSIFDYRGDPQLSLLSCTGVWNESRRIMNFSLISVEEL